MMNETLRNAALKLARSERGRAERAGDADGARQWRQVIEMVLSGNSIVARAVISMGVVVVEETDES
jgi:hypothetical protein